MGSQSLIGVSSDGVRMDAFHMCNVSCCKNYGKSTFERGLPSWKPPSNMPPQSKSKFIKGKSTPPPITALPALQLSGTTRASSYGPHPSYHSDGTPIGAQNQNSTANLVLGDSPQHPHTSGTTCAASLTDRTVDHSNGTPTGAQNSDLHLNFKPSGHSPQHVNAVVQLSKPRTDEATRVNDGTVDCTPP